MESSRIARAARSPWRIIFLPENLPEKIEPAWKGYVIYLCLGLLVFSTKYMELSRPLWGDEAKYAEPIISSILMKSGLAAFLPGHLNPMSFAGHPEGFPLTLAIGYWIFGHLALTAHTVSLCISFLCLCMLYKFGAYLFNARAGLLAAILVFSTPLFFSHSTMFYPNIFVAFLGLASCYLFFRKRFFLFALASGYLVFVRESGLAFTFFITLYALWEAKQRRSKLSDVYVSFFPHFVLALHYLTEKIVTGRFINQRIYKERTQSLGGSFLHWDLTSRGALSTSVHAFLGNVSGYFLLLGICIAAASFIPGAKKIVRPVLSRKHLTVFMPAGVFFLFFVLYDDYDTRDLTEPMIIALLLCSGVVFSALQRWFADVIVLTGAILFVLPQHFQIDSFDHSIASYRVNSSLMRDALRYMEGQKMPSPVFSVYPISSVINSPDLGWVGSPYTGTDDIREAKVVLLNEGAVNFPWYGDFHAGLGSKQAPFRMEKEFRYGTQYVQVYSRIDAGFPGNTGTRRAKEIATSASSGR